MRVFSLECVGFAGFYSSFIGDNLDRQLENDEYNRDSSLEYLDISFDYRWEDYKKDVSLAYMKNYIDFISDKLGKLDISNQWYTTIDSPKYYNYTTDRIFQDVKVSEDYFNKIMGLIRDNIGIADSFFKYHFTSRDGFVSFYSNDVKEWLEIDYLNCTDLELSYLLQCALGIALVQENGGECNALLNTMHTNFEMEIVEGEYYIAEYLDYDTFHNELREQLDKSGIYYDTDLVNGLGYWEYMDGCYIENNEFKKR